ncbi:MAG: hypothetical protein J7M27_05115 [Candidatus Latescibacteria bacterium]|nr:hypothetical protein [Candidatus Latescibacterota bacterium]
MKHGNIQSATFWKALILGAVDVWAALALYGYAWPVRNVLVRIWFNYAVPVSYMRPPEVPDPILYRYGLVALGGALLLVLFRLNRIERFRLTRMVFLPPLALLLQWGGLLAYHAFRMELNLYVFSALLVFWALFSGFIVLWRCLAWSAFRALRRIFPALSKRMESWTAHLKGEVQETVPSTSDERFNEVMARSGELISDIHEQNERVASLEERLRRLEEFRQTGEASGQNWEAEVFPSPPLPHSPPAGTRDGRWACVVGGIERLFQRWDAVRAGRRASLDGRLGIWRRKLRRELGEALRVLEDRKRMLRRQVGQIWRLQRDLRRRVRGWEEERGLFALAKQLGETFSEENKTSTLENRIATASDRMRALEEVLEVHYGLLDVPAPWLAQTHLGRFVLWMRALIASFKAWGVYIGLNKLRFPYRMVRYFRNDPAAIFIVTFMALLMGCAFLLMIPSFVGTYIPRGITVNIVRATFEKIAEQVANVAYFALVIGVLMRLVEYVREERSVKREA